MLVLEVAKLLAAAARQSRRAEPQLNRSGAAAAAAAVLSNRCPVAEPGIAAAGGRACC